MAEGMVIAGVSLQRFLGFQLVEVELYKIFSCWWLEE
jgi:hypothetical protein